MQIIQFLKSVLGLANAEPRPAKVKKMNIKQIDNSFYVSGQVGYSDLKSLAEQGIKSLICARPDLEEGNQPMFAELAAEAEKLGFKTLHVPIRPGQACGDDVERFSAGFKSMPKPILGFCRSGARAHALYQLSNEAAK